MTRSYRILTALAVVALVGGLAGQAEAAELDGPIEVYYDAFGVPTIVTETEHDVMYMQGFMHAKDRLFQMDFLRRVFSGRVSELVGPPGLPQDVQLRTMGLRRAAERSLPVQTPEVVAWMEAYSAGVNAYLDDPANPLPLEYLLLEIDRGSIQPWTPLDCLTMVKGLAFDLSFSLEDIDRTLAVLNFLPVCGFLGCNGLQLAMDDLYRTAPFEAVASIPPLAPPPAPPEGAPNGYPPANEQPPAFMNDPNFHTAIQDLHDTLADIPRFEQTLRPNHDDRGSNWWVVSGALSESGYPMLANDPHLSLGQPSTFYENHLHVKDGGINVAGVSFPGAPGIVLGCNDEICWGATVNSQDVTDVYQEVLLGLGPGGPFQPTHTFFGGAPEPLQFIPQQFNINLIGDGVVNTIVDAGIPAASGGVTMVVPRRLNGPIVQITVDPASPTPVTGISVQYVGWAATQELETFRRFARAGSMAEFKDALQYFDVGSQNWAYADIHGNIAYYTSGELPIREDFQLLFFPDALQGPNLIRDGTHTVMHEWLPLTNPQPNQAVPYEILPFAEMPQIENPAQGYILNANNDPIGTTFDNLSWDQFRPGFNGRLYLSSGYANGYRMGRLQRLLDGVFAGGGKMSREESIAVQANNQLLDAEILTPYLADAYANATAPGAAPELAALVGGDARIGDAIARLSVWDFSTPTGINQGFDPFDNPAAPGPPSAAEVDASVAATIYAAWRGQVVQRVIDVTLAALPIPLDGFAPGSSQAMSALRELLENYPINGGTGVSLINFFTVPGVPDQDVARDLILLGTLQSGLDMLASDDFAPAFANSTDLDDYRWGMLHRIRFSSFVDDALSIPPTGSPLNLAPDLPGLSRAGGMGAVDASSHSARADGLNEFMFGSGASRRVIATMEPDGPDVLEVIPGGESGLPGHPQQTDQLFLWLVNAFKPLPIALGDVHATAASFETYFCGDGVVGPGEECDDGRLLPPTNFDENSSDDDDSSGDGASAEDDGPSEPPTCSQECRLLPVVTCLAPIVQANPRTCDITTPCSAIASCVDPIGGDVMLLCDAPGATDDGIAPIPVQCTGAAGTTLTVCDALLDADDGRSKECWDTDYQQRIRRKGVSSPARTGGRDVELRSPR